MRNCELDAVVKSRTLSEVIDLVETLHIENQHIAQAAGVLLRHCLATGQDECDAASLRLLRAIKDTAEHCCRVIEGPR